MGNELKFVWHMEMKENGCQYVNYGTGKAHELETKYIT